MSVSVSNLDKTTIESMILDVFDNLQIKDSVGNIVPNYKHSAQIPYRYSHSDFSKRALSDISNSLTHNGIVILENFFSENSVDLAYEIISEVIDRARPFIEARQHAELEDLLINISERSDKKFKTYQEMGSATKPVLNYRGNKSLPLDNGLIDIFNVQNLNSELTNLFSSLENPNLLDAIGRFGNKKMRKQMTNVYYNENVTSTRGFHLDNTEFTAKAFVYLTDVKSIEDGPYCYGLGSHRNQKLYLINKMLENKYGLRSRDYTVLHKEEKLVCLAPKGSLIISYQFGAHRGAPQNEGHKRMMLVNSYV